MKPFSRLIEVLDSPAPKARKVTALTDYLRAASDEDRLWAIALLSGRRPKRVATLRDLQAWATEVSGLPQWVLDASFPVVGDMAETIALILPPPRAPATQPLSNWGSVITDLRHQGADARKSAVFAAWNCLGPAERVIFNKLVTGSFRTLCPPAALTDAIAQATGANRATLAHRLTEDWQPAGTSFAALIRPNDPAIGLSQPYPFLTPAALTDAVETLGDPAAWLAEWQWQGLPCQLIRRGGFLSLWSEDNALITQYFPEFAPFADSLPEGTAIAATLVAGADTPLLPRAHLDRRIGRKTPVRQPVSGPALRLVANDLLEAGGQDLRPLPFDQRHARLVALLTEIPADLPITVSQLISPDTWPGLTRLHAGARSVGAMGMTLTRRASAKGMRVESEDKFHWPADPLTVDALLVYATLAQGGTAPEFTFALFDPVSDDWQPIAKTSSGLSGAETEALAAWARKNTVERFGPVRRVPPERVFRIAFDTVQPSPRHRAGLALQGARILCALPDCLPAEVATITTLRALIRSDV